jgi:hypothetical protein
MIAAGNEITSYPYSYGGGHCVAAMQVPPGPSSCAGQWVTIYAGESGGQGHALIEVAGVVLDTVHGTSSTPPGTGPRWQPASEIAYELAHGSFVARHPPGL